MIAFGADIYVKRSHQYAKDLKKDRVREYGDMNGTLSAAMIAAFALLFFAGSSAQAQNRFKDCAAQWNALKEAKQTEGKSYREFRKGCLS